MNDIKSKNNHFLMLNRSEVLKKSLYLNRTATSDFSDKNYNLVSSNSYEELRQMKLELSRFLDLREIAHIIYFLKEISRALNKYEDPNLNPTSEFFQLDLHEEIFRILRNPLFINYREIKVLCFEIICHSSTGDRSCTQKIINLDIFNLFLNYFNKNDEEICLSLLWTFSSILFDHKDIVKTILDLRIFDEIALYFTNFGKRENIASNCSEFFNSIFIPNCLPKTHVC